MTILVEEKDVKCLFYPHNTTYEKYFPKNHSCNTKYLDCISQCHLLNLRIWCGDKIYVFKANPCLLMNNFPDHMLHCDFSKYTQRHIDSVEKIEYGYIFFSSFQDGVKWEIFWQWQSVRRQARGEATGSSSAVRRRCYTRGDIIFVCSMNDQVVNMNVGVPISFL